MKIITILLLMIFTQVLAEERVIVDKAPVGSYDEPGHGKDFNDSLTPDVPTDMDFQGEHDNHAKAIKQCNQIANVSKRTIKAAISGVPIAEVINKFTVPNAISSPFGPRIDPTESQEVTRTSPNLAPSAIMDPIDLPGWHYVNVSLISAIYKTVDQIKTKYGQVRPQDRVRLNNRVEQQLIKCREMAIAVDDKGANY